MTVEEYQKLAAMSVIVWRLIGMIRDPFLYAIRDKLVVFENDKQLYSTFVWAIAFLIGYVAATMSGESADILHTMGWADGSYPEIGYAATALIIASGSAGLRFVEKNLVAKFEQPTESKANLYRDDPSK